jgi:integrase
MQKLRRFLGSASHSAKFVFQTNRGNPLLETNILNQGLYPALAALGLEQAGMHAFRRGCNRRWELAGVKPAVIRQQMGHSSSAKFGTFTTDDGQRSQNSEQIHIIRAGRRERNRMASGWRPISE